MRRPGMAELAKAAGVSLATVDRALNGREKVRGETLAHLAEVARALGHPAAARLGGGGQERAGPRLRIGVILHKQGQDFYKAFAEALRVAADEAPEVVELVLEFSASQAPSEMAALMRAMLGRCDVLAATAVHHPEVTEAVADLAAAGLPVFSLLSGFAPGERAGYLGLDNLKVGRTAGWLMAQVARGPGEMAVFIGGHRWEGHAERDRGFRAALRVHAPQLSVLAPLVNLETRTLTYEATMGLLRGHSNLRGIYVAGGGMEGAIAALRDARAIGGAGGAGRADGAQVALIVSASTPQTRKGLRDGVVSMIVDTPLEALCRAMMRRMTLACGGTEAQPATSGPKDILLQPHLTLPE
jgi:LacI family transcriptional regulator